MRYKKTMTQAKKKKEDDLNEMNTLLSKMNAEDVHPMIKFFMGNRDNIATIAFDMKKFPERYIQPIKDYVLNLNKEKNNEQNKNS